jgi:pre-mRNA-processing factor 17
LQIWDVADHRRVRRTYLGHSAAVRQVTFGGDGREFISCGYDKVARVWDTETGACVGAFAGDKVPLCATWYPLDANIFLVGSASRKALQYDRRAPGAPVLEYNYHLDAVNTVTFVDDARRIVTTSDDKKILVWEFGAPVPIKYIADPSMHAVPTVTMHPSGECFAGQSMDNSVVVYSAGDRVSLNRKKHFTGHVTAGYACQLAFSPDGRHLASGDGEGQLWFWDWRTSRFEKKIRAHAGGPCIGAVWHPLRPSMMGALRRRRAERLCRPTPRARRPTAARPPPPLPPLPPPRRAATCGWDGVIALHE